MTGVQTCALPILQRCGCPVVVDEELLDECGVRPSGADAGELTLRVLDGALHLVDGVEKCLFGHPTSVPTGLPCRMDLTLPFASRSNTTMGRFFSMQKVMAVESMTFRPLVMTSMWEIRS